MNDELDRDLLRLLTGELAAEPAARLERAIQGDATLRRRYEEWKELWRDLELPPSQPSEGLLPAVRRRLARDRAEPDVRLRELWRVAPAWGRALAAASLAAGVTLGVWLGRATLVDDELGLLESYEPSLSESYWTGLDAGQIDGGEQR